MGILLAIGPSDPLPPRPQARSMVLGPHSNYHIVVYSTVNVNRLLLGVFWVIMDPGTTMSTLTESIFREYDIRGIAETELGDEAVGRIAAAAATIFLRENKTRIAIGMDGRPSSERIAAGVIRTLARPRPGGYRYRAGAHAAGLLRRLPLQPGRRPDHHRLAQPARIQRHQGHDRQIGPVRRRHQGDLPHGCCRPLSAPAPEKSWHAATSSPNTWSTSDSNIRLKKKIRVVVDGGNGTGGLTAPVPSTGRWAPR